MNSERELLKQVVENFAYVQDMHLIVAIQKLLNQPERGRPLSDEELEVWYSQHTWAMDEQEYTWGFRAYMAGFRDAEKMHDIGGGE